MADQINLYSLMDVSTPQCRQNISSAAQRSVGFLGKTRRAVHSSTPVQSLKFDDPFNDSFSGRNVSAVRDSLVTDASHNVSDYGGTLDFTVPPTEHSIDATTSTAMILAEEDPGLKVTKALCQEFRDLYVEYPGEHEIFELLLRYEEACSQNIQYLTKVVRKAGRSHQKIFKTINLLQEIRAERDTWRLLRILFKDRLESENMDEEDALMDTLGKKVSDKEIVDNLYLRNSFIRQSQLVVDWLEKNAADDFDEMYSEKMEHFSDQGVAWEHTLHTLLMRDTDHRSSTVNYLVTEMDPDAPLRQKNNSLSDIDKESNTRLLRFMFQCVRSGNLNEAQKLAEKYGQPWLAAALEGWRLHHDPNYNSGTDVEGAILEPVEGNPYRDIWKSVCWSMSNDGNVPLHEKAIFAALSGNLRALLPACDNWEDYLWAYFRVLVDQHIEEELYSTTQQERSLEDLPPLYWDKILDMREIFHDLKASECERIRKEGQLNLHVVQKFIILDDTDGLIDQLHSWLCSNLSKSSSTIRFMTHLIYFLRVIGRASKEEICVAIIESYIDKLIKSSYSSLVAAYTATLPAAKQVIWYAKFLEGITDSDARQQCLQYAEEAGLNVPAVTKTVVENMRGKDMVLTEESPALSAATTEEDKLKIEAIEWLVFDPTQRSEAVKQANALMRVFVASKKLDAAKQVFMKIPPDSLASLMEHWNRMTGNNELCAEDENAAREYLCFKAYLEAHDSFNDWFNHFQHGKPQHPESPVGDKIRFRDKVAYEHQLKEYETELEKWENAMQSRTKTTTERLYNIILFVGGGWMVDQRVEEDVDEGRQQQMSLLRKLCIPQICTLLRTVLHETKQYKECVQLADIIASERYQLYKEFSVQELRTFLVGLCESSIDLLDTGVDPLGYPFK